MSNSTRMTSSHAGSLQSKLQQDLRLLRRPKHAGGTQPEQFSFADPLYAPGRSPYRDAFPCPLRKLKLATTRDQGASPTPQSRYSSQDIDYDLFIKKNITRTPEGQEHLTHD